MDSEKLFNSDKEDKLIISFNKILKQFVKELNKTFPEYNILKIKEYKNIEDKDDKYILYFMNYIEKDIEKIANEDVSLLTHEDTYFLRDIEFSRIWNSGISENNKKAIWKFLQTLYLIGKPFIHNKPDIHSLIDSYSEIINNKENQDRETLKSIHKQSEIILQIIENLNIEKENRKQERKSKIEGQLPEFIENSKIGKLAQELSSELDLEELGFGNIDESADPQNIFSNVLGKNPQKLMGLIQNVGGKIQNKLSEGDINENDLVGEAQEMMSSLNTNGMFGEIFKNPQMKDMFQNMSGLFGNNPEMAEMFKNFNPDDIQNMANQFAQNPAQGGNNSNVRVDQNKVRNLETKNRLKKKLAEKKKKQDNSSESIVESEQSVSDLERSMTDNILNTNDAEKKHRKKKKKKPSQETINELKEKSEPIICQND